MRLINFCQNVLQLVLPNIDVYCNSFWQEYHHSKSFIEISKKNILLLTLCSRSSICTAANKFCVYKFLKFAKKLPAYNCLWRRVSLVCRPLLQINYTNNVNEQHCLTRLLKNNGKKISFGILF